MCKECKSKQPEGEKIKVLFFVESFGGGVFTYIVDLANSLSSEYDITVAYGLREQTPKDYKTYFNKNIALIQVKNYKREIDLKKDIKALGEMKKIARAIKPDVIHLHSSKSGVLGRIAFHGHKPALFYTPHGYSFLMDNCSTYKKKIYRFIEKMCSFSSCMTISCSYGEHLESLKLTRRATYISNGVNVEYLQALLDNLEQEKKKNFCVFTLGRICYQKNPKLFNEIARQLPQIQFLWIGDGELRSLLTSKNIRITGWVSRHKALEYSQDADIFVLTSLWEGLPLSLLEAMYMKKICMVTNVIGNRDVISSGINGFICENAEDFVKTIRNVQKDEAGFNRLKNNAYREILEKYNTKVMAQKYSSTYMGAINNAYHQKK